MLYKLHVHYKRITYMVCCIYDISLLRKRILLLMREYGSALYSRRAWDTVQGPGRNCLVRVCTHARAHCRCICRQGTLKYKSTLKTLGYSLMMTEHGSCWPVTLFFSRFINEAIFAKVSMIITSKLFLRLRPPICIESNQKYFVPMLIIYISMWIAQYFFLILWRSS